MARNYPADTQMQKCLEERYLKEQQAQFSWFNRKKSGNDKDQASEGPSYSKQYAVFKRKIEMAPRMNEDIKSRLPNVKQRSFHKKRFDHEAAILAAGDNIPSESRYDAHVLMRPPTKQTLNLLYDGFSKEGKGRVQYLSQRYKQNPEDKYTFPILSSNEYGWCLDQVIKKEDIKKSPYVRTRLISDTFYTRNGIPGGFQMSRSKTVF